MYFATMIKEMQSYHINNLTMSKFPLKDLKARLRTAEFTTRPKLTGGREDVYHLQGKTSNLSRES